MKIKLVGQAVFRDASNFAPKKTFFRRKCGTAKPHFFAPDRITAACSIDCDHVQKLQKAPSPGWERMPLRKSI